MFFRHPAHIETNDSLLEKIKSEIINTLRKKGVSISEIHIDLKSGSVNVSVSISPNNSP